MNTWNEDFSSLKENDVFVFGSNKSGFHGAGAAGLALSGRSNFNWRSSERFSLALKSPKDSTLRIGARAILGQFQGLQKGTIGYGYAIITIERPGLKRSVSLHYIEAQVQELIRNAAKNTNQNYYVSAIGCGFAGFLPTEIGPMFNSCPFNVFLPKSFLKS